MHAQLSQLLAAERSGYLLALRPYDVASVVRDAIKHHLETLSSQPPAESTVPELSLDPSLKRSIVVGGAVATRSIFRLVSTDDMARVTENATSHGLTLNALLLGSLAWLMHQHSQQSEFAIAQTYVGRRLDQLEAVGSYSTCLPMAFSFERDTSLQETCARVLRETLAVLKNGVAAGGSMAPPSFAYELNDVRPIPQPTPQQLDESTGVALVKDIFFSAQSALPGDVPSKLAVGARPLTRHWFVSCAQS